MTALAPNKTLRSLPQILFVVLLLFSPGYAAERPNIVWIVSEDNGPFLGCYGDERASTPNIDGLAKQGILFENAFANAPVCAPARSTIITGVYATSMGTHHMRSSNRVPEMIQLFPYYLRQAGYYCTNRSKTDYNLRGPSVGNAWDESSGRAHYRKRKQGQPFFAVFNIGTSHESSLHRSKVEKEYLNVDFELPPYHPDTPEIRSNWVQYYRIISRMDSQVGEILAELEAAGLADNTIVFYYADHGGILTRSKRFLFDTGVHVPMVVRFPKKWQHLAPQKPGARFAAPVSFVDLAPTVLNLAGIDIPSYMQGSPFLGEDANVDRQYAFIFRGRMDERYDMMRGVTDGRYKYIRNYMPHRIYGQHLDYLWRMPATKSWEAQYLAGKCDAVQSRFWQPKPTEELYDTHADRWEVNNLASDPAHQKLLQKLRQANRDHLLRIRDAGFLPESEMISRAEPRTIYEMVRDESLYPLTKLVDAAELAGERNPANLPRLARLMAADDAGLRYWGATGCAALGAKAAANAETLKQRLGDDSPSVQIVAAEALCQMDRHQQKAVGVLQDVLVHEDPRVRLRAINTLHEIGEDARPALPAIKAATKNGDKYVVRAAEWTAQILGEDE